MKPRLSKAQRKALRFSYKLLCGDYDNQYLPYVYGSLRYDADGKPVQRKEWIEPDRTNGSRSYLNEDTFSVLEMRGYMEAQQFMPDGVWLYRLTRDGCMAMGWEWPLHPPYAGSRRKLLRILARSRNGTYYGGIMRYEPPKGTRLRDDPHNKTARYDRFRHR
jgi:hypothetical protein